MIDQFYLAPDSEPYRQAIFDVIRIFLPQFQWVGSTEDAAQIAVTCTEQTWTLTLGSHRSVFVVTDLDENQRRRQLKQHLYSLLKQETGAKDCPWGIMTGIRPTKIVHRYWDAGIERIEIMDRLRQEYMLGQDKIDLLTEVTERQRPFLLNREEAKELVSIYLSIPFCPTRCAYCSFPSFCLPKPPLQERYLTNLLAECKAVGEALRMQGKQIQTVYVGGGTPTSLSAAQLLRLLSGIQQHLGWSQLAEFTVEAGRPDTITAEKLQLLHDYHVNRISINPQTFSQPTLDRIGRRHTVQQILETYALAQKIGFASINMDLIMGLTGETVKDFAQSLAYIETLQPENLTVHTLAIKRTAALQMEAISQNQNEIVEEMQQYLQQWRKTQAYVPYYLYRQKHMIGDQENTGYCLPKTESLYNIQMMEERQTILGLGVGSTSKYVHAADWTLTQNNNPKDLFFYNERIAEIIAKKQAYIAEL